MPHVRQNLLYSSLPASSIVVLCSDSSKGDHGRNRIRSQRSPSMTYSLVEQKGYGNIHDIPIHITHLKVVSEMLFFVPF